MPEHNISLFARFTRLYDFCSIYLRTMRWLKIDLLWKFHLDRIITKTLGFESSVSLFEGGFTRAKCSKLKYELTKSWKEYFLRL